MVTARGFTAVGDSRMSMAIFYIQLRVSWVARKTKNKNPFLCVSNNEISFGSSRHREEALSSPFLHTDVYTIHAYIHTELHFYIYVHTQKKDTIKSSTMKKLNPPYPFVQACRINMCKRSQHWNGFHSSEEEVVSQSGLYVSYAFK